MTRTDRIQLDYELTFAAPFHCGTGLRVGLVDRTVVRDQDGYLYVPGSTLKGCLREQCEWLERLYEVLDDEMRDRIGSPHDARNTLLAMGQPLTMVTRIFGATYYPGRLVFNDARQIELEEDYKPLQTGLSTQVRLDRPTRTAVPGALYTSEFGIRHLTLRGSINGWLSCTPIKALEEEGSPTYSLLLLLAGLHMLDRLGGNKSTGKGRCSIEIKDLLVNGAELTSDQWQPWLDHLEALSLYSTDGVSQEEGA